MGTRRTSSSPRRPGTRVLTLPRLALPSTARHPVLLAVSVAVFAQYTGIGMVSFVRVLFAQSHGASLAIIGAMGSSYLLANFAFQYPAGALADRFGHRRLMAVSLAGQVVLTLLYLTVGNPVLFVVLRLAEGILGAAFLPPARAMIADVIPEEGRGEAYGIFGAFFNAGFLFGPALGGVLGALSFPLVFYLSALVRAVAMILVLGLIPAAIREHHEGQEARVPPHALAPLLTLPLTATYILAFGDYLWLGFDLTLLPLWMRDHLGASVLFIGIASAAWAVPNVLLTPLGGRVADRVTRYRLILTFGLLQLPFYAVYGLLRTALPMLPLFALHGGLYAFLQPAVDTELASSSPPTMRARAQSLYSTVGLASAFLGANLLTWLYSINYRLPLVTMGVVYGVCILLGGWLIRKDALRQNTDHIHRMEDIPVGDAR